MNELLNVFWAVQLVVFSVVVIGRILELIQLGGVMRVLDIRFLGECVFIFLVAPLLFYRLFRPIDSKHFMRVFNVLVNDMQRHASGRVYENINRLFLFEGEEAVQVITGDLQVRSVVQQYKAGMLALALRHDRVWLSFFVRG